MLKRFLLGFPLVSVALVAHAAGDFERLPFGPDLAAAGWRTFEFPGIAATRFAGRPDGSVALIAEKSSSFLYRRLPESPGGGMLSWQWRLEHPTAPTDLTKKGEDDRPLAIHVWFAQPAEESGLFARLNRSIREDVVGLPPGGMVLTYVWGGELKPGARFLNPYAGDSGVMIVLRDARAETGRWFAEKVDLKADFERAFGYPPPAPSFIALSADSDDNGGRSVALVRDISLHRP